MVEITVFVNICLFFRDIELLLIAQILFNCVQLSVPFDICTLLGYHADTPITMKAKAIHEADSRIH